jgi:limonene-1,2-epoxide hydrolase
MTTTPDRTPAEPLTVAEAFFDAWTRDDPAALADVLAPDVVVRGPLGRIDGAAAYQHSLGRIFGITRELDVRHWWVDGNDVLTWFDLYPYGGAEPYPVASWLHVEAGQITQARVTFDLGKLLQAGDPRRGPSDRGPR